jgi:hypothetical protein
MFNHYAIQSRRLASSEAVDNVINSAVGWSRPFTAIAIASHLNFKSVFNLIIGEVSFILQIVKEIGKVITNLDRLVCATYSRRILFVTKFFLP